MDRAVRVLHVDDEPEFADLTATFLREADERFAVETVTSPVDALDALSAETHDCIVSDYDMARMTGIEFLETVRERYPDMPFILFTGKGSEEIASEAISAGVTDYLQKGSGTEQYDLLANRIVNAVDRAHAQAQARQSRDRFRSLSEAYPDVAFYIDETGEYVDILAGDESPLLYDDAEQLVGHQFRELLPSGTAERFLDVVDRALETDSLQTIEYQLEVKAGTRWFEARVVPLEASSTDREMVIWVARDITQYKEREGTLTALHSAAQEVGRSDDLGAVYETLIATAKRILEFDIVSIYVEREGNLVQEAWTMETDSKQCYEKTSIEEENSFAVRTFRNGTTILAEDVGESELTPTDSGYRSVLSVPLGAFGVFQAASSDVRAFDEHDREFAELLVNHARIKLAQLADKERLRCRTEQLRERTDELERKNERLDEFASVVSHDLRNPLNTLELSLELAERTGEEDHFERCYRAVDRMDSLLEDVLSLAREGQEVDDLELVDLETVAREAWLTVETAGGELIVETSLTLRTDSGRLKQLLENLFRNSVEHGSTSPDSGMRGSDGRNVTVTVGDLDGGFYVEDNGPGIPEADREKIFDAGYSTAGGGNGLGLRIVEQVVEAHGWSIRATDGTEGGARFEVTGVEIDE